MYVDLSLLLSLLLILLSLLLCYRSMYFVIDIICCLYVRLCVMLAFAYHVSCIVLYLPCNVLASRLPRGNRRFLTACRQKTEAQ